MIKLLIPIPVLFFVMLSSLISASDFLKLEADHYTLKMTETVKHPKVDYPSDKIPDDEYLPNKKPWILSLKFSKDRKKVEIFNQEGKQIYEAVLTSVGDDKRVYEMTRKKDKREEVVIEGKIAIEMVLPEYLTIERTKAGLRGTYTLHGSGVPIISSTRGVMVPVPHKAEAGADQPATRPESKSEGSQKPQPEAEGHSR